jgi:hypothetical protein
MRVTLNGQPPHTLRDSMRDQCDWWEGPHEAVLLTNVQPWRPRYDVESAGHRMVMILSIVGCIGFLVWALIQVLV